MKNYLKYVIIGVAIVASAWLLANAYTYKYRSEDTITVTGLGETEFESDLIVWGGSIYAETGSVADGYERMETYKRQVLRMWYSTLSLLTSSMLQDTTMRVIIWVNILRDMSLRRASR